MADKTSRKPHLVRLNYYTTYSIIMTVNEFTAPCDHPVTVEHINIRKIKTDSGTEFRSSYLCEACANANIELSITSSKHQEQNHAEERTWYSRQTIDAFMLVHTGLTPKCPCHTSIYAIEVLSGLPVKKLTKKAG
jgi:hypothetical protein